MKKRIVAKKIEKDIARSLKRGEGSGNRRREERGEERNPWLRPRARTGMGGKRGARF